MCPINPVISPNPVYRHSNTRKYVSVEVCNSVISYEPSYFFFAAGYFTTILV
jgi:hypothetical protein